MSIDVLAVSGNGGAGESAALGLDLAVKAAMLLLLAYLAHILLGRRRILARAALWNACLLGLLMLPIAARTMPRLAVSGLGWIGGAVLRVDDGAEGFDHSGADTPSIDRIELESVRSDGLDAVGPRADAGAGSSHRPGYSFQGTDPAIPGGVAGPRVAPNSRALSKGDGKESSRRAWKTELSGSSISLSVYVVVAAILLGQLALALVAVRRLRVSSRALVEPESAWQKRLEHWRTWLGIDHRIWLAVSDRATVPIAAGWLEPWILLPASLERSTDSRLIDAVLLHELCHIKRGDYFWNLVHRVVSIVYWPHPLVWPLGRLIRHLREQACDELCVHALDGPASYREALLEVAAGLVAGRSAQRLEIGMAMARSTRLGWRLARIERSRGLARCLPGRTSRWALLASLTLLAAFLGPLEAKRTTAQNAVAAPGRLTQDQPNSKPAAFADAQVVAHAPSSTFELTVLDSRTSKPIPGATVRSLVDGRRDFLTTDEQGRVGLPRSKDTKLAQVGVDVWKDGYIQQRYAWGFHQKDGPIPGRFTIKLLPGEVTWGGTVHDEAGKPIPGVLVEVWGYLKEVKEPHELCSHVRSTTDAQGRWSNSSLREMSFVYLYLSHPDFVSDGDFHPRPFGQPADRDRAPSPALERLRKHTDVQVMQRGIEVRGKVIDQDGRPVPGALVGWVSQQFESMRDVPKATTIADGGFRIAHVRPGNVTVIAKAAGRSPGLVVAEARAEANPIEIRVSPGRRIAGRVVDPQGKPIEGAFVGVDPFGGYQSLRISLRTDREGRFRWDEAPADGITLNVGAPGYLPLLFRNAPADGKEAIFTLTPSLQIAGRVRDETTRKPLSQNVAVEVGLVDVKTGEVTRWEQDDRATLRQGFLEVNLDATRSSAYKLRFVAVGYEPLVTRVFESREGYAYLDLSMKKLAAGAGKGATAIFRASAGRPLAGAQVVVSLGGDRSAGHVWLAHGKISGADQQMIATTGADGRFSLPQLGANYKVMAFTDAYYAIAGKEELEETHELRAEPWGRIEGQLFVGARPGAGYFIDLHPGTGTAASGRAASEPSFSVSDQVQTDAEGRFVFPHVLPGSAYLYYGLTSGRKDGGNRGNFILTVAAGQTVHLTLGGKGRPVVGRLAAPPDFGRPFDFANDFFKFRIEINKPWSYVPPEALKSKDVLRAMSDASRTAERVAYWSQFIQINIQPKDDGSFRVDDMLPGTYRCTTYLSGFHSPQLASASGRRIAHLEHFFTVPEMPGGRSDEPLDLGTIALHLLNPKPPGGGDIAPPFEVTTLDGKSLKLADYRGKLVLLNFWAPWKLQSLFQIPYLKDAAESFPADKFAIINLVPDADPAESRKLAAEVGLPGALGFLGQWTTSAVIRDYEVEQLPATFLIASDGKILESSAQNPRRLWMTQFKEEISKAISK